MVLNWLRASLIVLCVLAFIGLPSQVDAAKKAQLKKKTTSSPFSLAWEAKAAGYVLQAPTIADLNNDGVDEILIADYKGTLRVFDKTGKVLWATNVGGLFVSSVAVGDINGNSVPEVCIGVGALNHTVKGIGVVCMTNKGKRLWRFPIGTMAQGGGLVGSVSLGDIDGDGINDVVFGAIDHKIYALNGKGKLIKGFPFDNLDTVQSTPALYDIDCDGQKEIIIGADATKNTRPPYQSHNGGQLYVFRWVDGVRVQMIWRKFTNIVRSAIAIGIFNGRPAAVFATGGFKPYAHTKDSRKVWAIYIDDTVGGNVPGWPRTTIGEAEGSAAIADLDGNGEFDVVFGDALGYVYAWRKDGHLLWRTRPVKLGFTGGPVIGDLRGNGQQDVALSDPLGGALLLNGRNGKLLVRLKSGYSGQSSPAIYTGPHGKRLLIFAGVNPFVKRYASGMLFAYNLARVSAAAQKYHDDWPMYGQNARHLGYHELLQNHCEGISELEQGP